MKVAIDVMGGDFAPQETVQGAVMGAREHEVGLFLVGPQDKINLELAKYETKGLDIEIIHTEEYLLEGEAPAYALRTKRNASIAVATRLVKDGKAQAVISMGPTGGVITSALMFLGTIEGISRPVVGGTFCGFTPQSVAMDIGGNIDSRPDQLLDFAIVGTVYVRKILGISNPTVALLNVGWEAGKGNSQVKEAFSLLKKSGLNFIGNIEGNDVPAGKANVIICDGFVGNIMAKFYEGVGKTISDWLENKLKNDLPDSRVSEISHDLRSLTIMADNSGGGPIWAVNGLAFKGHGRSRAREMALTVGSAKKYADMDIINALKSEFQSVRQKLQFEK